MGEHVARIRVVYFSTWIEGLEDARSYLATMAKRDLRSRLTRPDDPDLARMARLDRDWDAECLRCFVEMRHPALDPLPARVADARGVLRFLTESEFDDGTPWLVLIDQRPVAIAPVVGRLLRAFTERGGRVLYWAYDEASRTMDCFDDVAPSLSVLIHDESPLAENGRRALPDDCRTLHRSWVANIVPFAYPFDESPSESLVFLASRLGVTEHRLHQVRALESHFGKRFRFIADHSIPVAERGQFASIKAHVCPEGRKFATPAMSDTHTDRPFWAGCMGEVPVAEDSSRGGRLEPLARDGLVLRYAHNDIPSLIDRCESALATDVETRRRIYDHFNRHETIGPAAAAEIAAFHGLAHGPNPEDGTAAGEERR